MDLMVKKRNGQLVSYDKDKIYAAMLSALYACDEYRTKAQMNVLLYDVEQGIKAEQERVISIEKIQDIVEEVLMLNCPKVGKAYVLYRNQRTEARKARMKPDVSAISDYIVGSKYARIKEGEKRRETFQEIVDRVEGMHIRKFPKLEKEIRNAFELVREKKVLPSMRSMQFAGKSIEEHNARMYNCCFTLMDRPRAFSEMFYLLLCGCGVGFSIQWQHIEKLPRVERTGRKVKHHLVEDTIEGWAEALDVLIYSYMRSKNEYIEFSYENIRSEGSPLKTSGGYAPGHLPLKRCLEVVRERLDRASGRQLRPIEVLDIVCFIAEAVLSGGIRRSSLIGLFSITDTEMMYAKAPGNFEPKGVNNQRQMVNISPVMIRNKVRYSEFERVLRISQEGYGEPGIYFSTHADYGCNPCGEIGLYPKINTGVAGFGFCNLSEIVVPNCCNGEELRRAARIASFIGTLQATYTDFRILSSVSKKVAERDALLGVSMTGMMDNPDLAFDPAIQKSLAAEVMRENHGLANMLGIKVAKRFTAIKPSGTASLAVGCCGSGIHPHHARRYFRRVTANPNEPMAQFFKKVNPHMVETKPNGDWCLKFPIQAPDDAIILKKISAHEMLERVFSTYENWILSGTRKGADLTHNISCTITVEDGELKSVMEKVWENKDRIAAITTAPMTLDKTFPYAPREAIIDERDEREWNYLIKHYYPIDWTELRETELKTSFNEIPACESRRCEL